MSEQQNEAVEAAQHVVDHVTSYEYSAGEEKIAEQLSEGMDQVGVRVDAEEQERLTHEIDALKGDEDGGTPEVRQAQADRDA